MIALPGPLINTTSPSDIAIFPEKMAKKCDFLCVSWKIAKPPILTEKVPQEPGGAHTS